VPNAGQLLESETRVKLFFILIEFTYFSDHSLFMLVCTEQVDATKGLMETVRSIL